jgi:hypothetical protein
MKLINRHIILDLAESWRAEFRATRGIKVKIVDNIAAENHVPKDRKKHGEKARESFNPGKV